ncbi:hypothetical protein ElyMa_006542700 [Elysia marginata]|uniref:CCHC-type domain-containing protein n=1 Tax=Elysia marginata TaxID=1093978 RepID=A0AAV4IB70_9GAST|nr:hypothetical protein ElyMa_006542700 [Elysia marginata]
MEGIRDPPGKLTEWLSGRRFVWIDLPKATIDPVINVGLFKGRLFFKEMITEMIYRRCLEKGHTARFCTKEEVCLHCKKPGHRAADCSDKKKAGQDEPRNITRPEQEDENGMQEGVTETDNPSETDESDSTQTRHKSPEGWSTAKKKKVATTGKITKEIKRNALQVQLTT